MAAGLKNIFPSKNPPRMLSESFFLENLKSDATILYVLNMSVKIVLMSLCGGVRLTSFSLKSNATILYVLNMSVKIVLMSLCGGVSLSSFSRALGGAEESRVKGIVYLLFQTARWNNFIAQYEFLFIHENITVQKLCQF